MHRDGLQVTPENLTVLAPHRALLLPHGSSVCRRRAPCKPSSVIGTSVSLRRIDRACYQDRCDVHSDTSDDTDSHTRRAAKTLSTRATRSRPHSCSDITDHDERRRSAPLGHATGARRLSCDFGCGRARTSACPVSARPDWGRALLYKIELG